MSRKIKWLLLFIVIIITVIIVGYNYYPFFPVSDETVIINREEFVREDDVITLIAVGDISYSRGVEMIVTKQQDINYPFLRIRDYLKDADLVFGNLETPITPGRKIVNFEMIFRSNPGTEQALKQAGFSILSLANNHTPNFGAKGLADTINYLNEVGIKSVGAGANEQEANRPVYLEKKGIKFAFLAYNDPDVVPASYEASETGAGTAFMRVEKMTKAINEAKRGSDFVIVSMHSGTEYVENPNNSQISFARAAIEAGADLVLGHHPHVIQTIEKYQGKYILYSLGNFVFDQPQSQETRDSLIAKIYFTKEGISKISLLPVTMENLAQPTLANASGTTRILDRLNFPIEKNLVYFWNSEASRFDSTYRAVIYNQQPKNNQVLSKKENYDLDHGQLTITDGSKLIWQSPTDWWVDNFALADSDGDGRVNLNLSVWKSGDFGSSKPFWIKENDLSIKNHFFVFDFVNSQVKPIWQSSNLTAPNCQFAFADLDDDGLNELITLEGDYLPSLECRGNHLAIWKWNGWGFSNEWRSEKGDYSSFEINKISGKTYIMSNSINMI